MNKSVSSQLQQNRDVLAILLPSLLSLSLLFLNLEWTDLFKTHQNPWWISGNRCYIAIRLPSSVPFLQTLLSQYTTKKKTANKLGGVVHILLYWGHPSFPQRGREGDLHTLRKRNWKAVPQHCAYRNYSLGNSKGTLGRWGPPSEQGKREEYHIVLVHALLTLNYFLIEY